MYGSRNLLISSRFPSIQPPYFSQVRLENREQLDSNASIDCAAIFHSLDIESILLRVGKAIWKKRRGSSSECCISRRGGVLLMPGGRSKRELNRFGAAFAENCS
jgi:hypothetical protein